MGCCCCPRFAEEDEYTTGCWKFFLKIDSAKNLPNARKLVFFKTRAYAKIYVGSDVERTEHRTDSDDNNGLNPAWDHPVIAYETTESAVQYECMTVTIKLYTKRSLGPDRYIVEVRKTMKELFEGRLQDGSKTLLLPIMRGSVRTPGLLDISYSFEKRSEDVSKSHFKGKGRGSVASFTQLVLSEALSQVAVYFAVLALTA